MREAKTTTKQNRNVKVYFFRIIYYCCATRSLTVGERQRQSLSFAREMESFVRNVLIEMLRQIAERRAHALRRSLWIHVKRRSRTNCYLLTTWSGSNAAGRLMTSIL